MPEFAVVKFSQLGDRLDPAFHIALDKVRGRVDELAASMTADEAIARLDAVALADKQALKVLVRGRIAKLDTAGYERVTREYPHLALAIMETSLAPSIERVREQIARNQRSLDALLALSPDLSSEDEEPSGPRP